MNKWLISLCFALIFTLGLTWLIKTYPNVTDDNMSRAHLISLVTVLAWMSLRFLSPQINKSQAFHDIVVWIGIGCILLIGYNYKNQLYNQLFPSRAMVSQSGELKFTRNDDGHFYVEALVNNQPVRFLVDTGASRIALPQSYCERIGIDDHDLDYTMPMSTANGLTMNAPIKVRKIALADHFFYDIPASVAQEGLDQPLLGMSFLNKLKSWRIESDTLIFVP